MATSNNVLWSGPRLMVPMTVEAVVVTKPYLNSEWAYLPMKYYNIDRTSDITPDFSGNLTSSSSKPPVGIILQWSLPDGFTQGIEDVQGDVEYPYAPNRWLVVRNASVMAAWVVESDFKGTSEVPGTSAYPNLNGGLVKFIQIGRQIPLTEWQGEQNPTEPFLQAIGPGYPGFSTFSADIQNVFSFHDDMSGIENTKELISYTIVGWYADPTNDPLYGKREFGASGWTTETEWADLMNMRYWSVGDSTDLQISVAAAQAWLAKNGIVVDPSNKQDYYAAQTLCEGLVFNINWEGVDGPTQSGVPTLDNIPPSNLTELPQIAVGNTSIDALSALVNQELIWQGNPIEGVELFLQELQYDLLMASTMTNQRYLVETTIMKAWYTAQYGGREWLVIDPDASTQPDLPDPILAQLIALNQLQGQSDQETALLERQQRELYALWWKKLYYDLNIIFGFPPAGVTIEQFRAINEYLVEQLDPENANSFISQVANLQQSASNDQASLLTAISNLREALSALSPPLSLQEKNRPSRWEANEPVMLVYGAKRSYMHGSDGRFTDNQDLFTRFTGQHLYGIKVAVTDTIDVIVDERNITIPTPTSLAGNPLLPKEVESVWIEHFFLNTSNAEAIAMAACAAAELPYDPALVETIQKQQTLIWNTDVDSPLDQQTLAELSGLQLPPNPSKIPSLVGINAWIPPWNPLYLSWDIRWLPSSQTPSDIMSKWKYDPAAMEYVWDSLEQPDPWENGQRLSGYTLITPASTFVLQQKLATYLAENPNSPYEGIKGFVDTVANWDFLSQSIRNFNDMLIQWNGNQLNAISESDSAYAVVGEETNWAPRPDMTIPFVPIRAGHFVIENVLIVDVFGQVFNPIAAQGLSPRQYKPIIGQGLRTTFSDQIIQLPPRLMQPMRLNFELVSADDKMEDIWVNPEANPVCGWILPNHIDRGITVYDASGKLLGEILLVGGQLNKRLRWDPVPGGTVPVGQPLREQITNLHLLGFVEGLINQSNSAGAYQDLITVIDETMWTVDPLGGRTDSNLSVLVGRPLALVRASLEYDMAKVELQNQQWLSTTESDRTDGYLDLDFPVWLGSLLDQNDGLMGYFKGTDYSQMNSVHRSELIDPKSQYIVNESFSLKLNQATSYVTLLLDPRGTVNAATGILPVQTQELPARYVDSALEAMEVTFRTGPLITNPNSIRMPLPAEINGKWSWIQHAGVTVWEEVDEIEKTTPNALLKDSPANTLKEGWLKLADALGNNTAAKDKTN
ncbi:MAG: hypothetical protein AAFP19_00035 [Bacteroidota bacterium]